jgi:hypothetical protein
VAAAAAGKEFKKEEVKGGPEASVTLEDDPTYKYVQTTFF